MAVGPPGAAVRAGEPGGGSLPPPHVYVSHAASCISDTITFARLFRMSRELGLDAVLVPHFPVRVTWAEGRCPVLT